MDNLRKIQKTKGKVAAIFKVKEKIVGNKKINSDGPTAVKDPTTNELIFKPSKILSVCATYVKELLTNREPREDFITDVTLKNKVHKKRMTETTDNDVEFSKKIFNNTLETLRKKGGSKYRYILKAGDSLLNALYKLYEVVWTYEEKPDKWRDTTVIQLNKKPNETTDLNKKRHIHLKEDPIVKFFGHMVASSIKPIISDNISPFQIGAMPGHRVQEHLFSIKSVIAMKESNKESVALLISDLAKYFDSESLTDVLDELYKLNVRGRLYKLVYELNKNTRIKVRTNVGETKEILTGENVAQGSLEGSLISSGAIGKGVEDFFEGSEYEASYGPLTLNPFQLQDDILRLCEDTESAQKGNYRLETMAELKLLSFNLEKCKVVIMGEKTAKEKLEDEFTKKPPTLNGKAIEISNHEPYLGDVLGSNVSESITLTIKRRTGLIKKSIFEIKAIVEDSRSQVNGGIETGLLLWKSCVLPYMLCNSSSWLQMKQKDIDTLTKLQNLFLGQLLSVQKCPSLLMLWDLGMETIHLRIMKEKLMLYHHISCLPKNSIALRIKDIQEKFCFPSLKEEILPFLSENMITDVTSFSKKNWKVFIDQKMKEENRRFILEGMKKYKKVDYWTLAAEEYELKPYFKSLSLSASRTKFRVQTQTVKSCRLHFPSNQQFIREMFVCPEPGCSEMKNQAPLDSLQHWVRCSSYAEKRKGMDLSDETQLLQYYQFIIKHREASL